MMISDKGNYIKSVKFTVWMDKDYTGYIEVAFHQHHRPKGTSRDTWKRKFFGLGDLMGKMDLLNDQVKTYNERALEKEKVTLKGCPICEENVTRQQQPKELVSVVYCPRCNTVYLKEGQV